MTNTGLPLPGDWRRRIGSKTDAHLYAPSKRADWERVYSDQRPLCGKIIPRWRTSKAELWTGKPISRSNASRALPCTACLVMAITRPYTANVPSEVA